MHHGRPEQAAVNVAIDLLGSPVLGFCMHRLADAALAAFSMGAQGWQAGRHIAAWWLRIATNVI